MLNYTRIPAPRVTLVDPQTGIVANEWFRFFNNLYSIAYAATGSVTAGTYGSATAVPQITVDDFGGITAVTNVPIAIDASQIVSGTIASARISGAYTGITGVGTLTVGTWNASTIGVGYGGTGQTSYTDGQILIGNSTGNTLTKATITAGTAIGISNGAGAITITNTLPDQTVVLTNGTGISVTGTYPNFTITNTAPSSGGTVTSVTGTSPVVSSGGTTPAISLATAYGDTLNPYASKTANYFLAAPNGSAGAPTFRAMVAADVPALAYVTSVSGTGTVNGITLTGTVTSSGSLTLGGTLSGIGNSQLTNSTISGVALGGSLFNLTAGTGVTFSTGTTYNGSAAITINATGTGGTVTSVAALTIGTTGTDLSSTVANGTTTPVITLNVPTASAANRGALSAADWTTFNNKAPGVTFTTNYIPYGQGTTTLNQSAGLQFDGTNFTTTGTASATKLIPTGGAVTGNGIYLPAANSIGLTTNGVVRTYWDASNHTLVGGVTTSRASLDYALQVETTNSLAGISAYRNQNVAGAAPAMWLGRSRGATNGSFTAVQSGDTLGALVYSGADGTTDVIGAAVSAIVGNTVSSNVVPTYLTFRTMNDAGTYAERMRLFASGGVSIGNTTDPGATNLSVTGFASAASFRPTSATIPTNGMYLPAANTIGFAINSANAVTLNSTGLGIGIGPSFKLHVSGASGIVANFAATGQAGVQLTSGTATSPYINWYSSGTTLEASIYALAGSGAFIIGTGASGAEKMRVYSGGGVSIGNTTSPGAGGLRVSGLMYPQQATTAGAPAYVKGALYFDTTLNKLRVGGATAWETITSV